MLCTINEELIKKIKEDNLPVDKALLFCFAVEYQEYGILDVIFTTDIVDVSTEYLYRINMTRHNPETNLLELRIPLFKQESQKDDFDLFFRYLISDPSVVHNSRLFTDDKETRRAFHVVREKIPEFDLNRFAKASIQYYKAPEYCKGLRGYLDANAYAQYYSYRETESNWI